MLDAEAGLRLRGGTARAPGAGVTGPAAGGDAQEAGGDAPEAGGVQVPGRIAAFFDVDRTVVRGWSMLALAGPLRQTGLLSRRVTVAAALRGRQFSARGFSERDVRRAVLAVSALVRGMDAQALRRAAEEAIPRVLAPRVFDEARSLMAWHRRHGHLVFLVSASTHELIDGLGRLLDADGVVASEAEIVDGHYTGSVALCHGLAKARALRRLAVGHGIDLRDSYAYGDGIGDLPMLSLVGHPVAVNPDRRLRAVVRSRGWKEWHFHRVAGGRAGSARVMDRDVE